MNFVSVHAATHKIISEKRKWKSNNPMLHKIEHHWCLRNMLLKKKIYQKQTNKKNIIYLDFKFQKISNNFVQIQIFYTLWFNVK